MKGVILAGGLGKRLYPLTKTINKHLLPVYSQPMIYYPIQTLVKAGIRDILIVTTKRHAWDFSRQLDKPWDLGIKSLSYVYQAKENGIAAALSLAERFAKKEKIVVILGDNILEKNINKAVRNFSRQSQGARIMIKKVPDPQRFGVVEFRGRKIISLKEKPRKPKSNYAVVGVYMFDHRVFDIIRRLRPSLRGELEITDVNKVYLKENKLSYEILKGRWQDAGTFDSLLSAAVLAARRKEV
ncbi:MAG: NTP transferase domain-containing protein [Candidatus Omnitrophica bacterium]|nr:NTP transferase domain-containing protein [Candidatus Omnitrophota bacterium]